VDPRGRHPRGAARERYLTQVPVNARLIALGRAWLGDEAVTPSNLGRPG
jgi:hypothetical protein